MKTLYDSVSYQEFLKTLVYSPEAKRGDQVKIAKAMGCQAAYLSQVLKGKAEMTEDHAIRLAQYLNLTDIASEYLLIMVRIARASSLELKHYLERKRAAILEQSREIKTRIQSTSTELSSEDLQRYFRTWIPSTIHAATSSDKYQTEEALSARFGISIEKIKEVLLFLESLELVKRENKKWKFAGGSRHFPQSSPFDKTHQINRRLQALRAIEIENRKNIHFSSIFTIDRLTLAKLNSALLDFIELSHKEIHSSGTEELFAMTIDLFEVV